jgi:uncharacterized protein YhhL (DUF1145 family)
MKGSDFRLVFWTFYLLELVCPSLPPLEREPNTVYLLLVVLIIMLLVTIFGYLYPLPVIFRKFRDRARYASSYIV